MGSVIRLLNSRWSQRMNIARVRGIPIRIHWSFWLLIAGYGLVGLQSGGVFGLLESLSLMAVLFSSVILHELGHALAARWFGVSTAHITLYPFGGLAALRSEPKGSWAEFVIAVAGPLVNGVLFALGALAWLGTGWIGFAIFAGLNLVMGVFNLIPAFPMDGGRVLRAILSPIVGWWKASHVVIVVGRLFAILFVVAAVVTWSMNLLIVGGFLLFATGVEGRKLKFLRRHRDQTRSNPQYTPAWSVRPRSH